MASDISLSSPCAAAYPAASPYPIVSDVSVTPLAVAPLAVPWPHGDASVPKSVAAGAVVGATVVPPVPGFAPLEWFPPHAFANRPSRSRLITPPARNLVGG